MSTAEVTHPTTEEQPQTLPEILRACRLRTGLNQADYGQRFDNPVSDSTVSRWERGLAEPSISEAVQIAVMGHWPIAELLAAAARPGFKIGRFRTLLASLFTPAPNVGLMAI